MWQTMEPGTYKVSFGPVPGFVTPGPLTATVAAGTGTSITGSYVSAPAAPEPFENGTDDRSTMIPGATDDAVATPRPETQSALEAAKA